MLRVDAVTKHLGGNLIVDAVSFEIEDGEFFVLLGPSGSGKSTLLRLISGLEQAESGTIWVDGTDITTMTPRDRNLGMVFQDYGLYPNMNVFQNIAYGLEARGVKKSIVQERVPQAAAELGLSEHLNSSVVDLSGGEQQRVALARAMVKDADAYLYDEPLSNLDPKLRHKARRDIMRVHRVKRKSSLYVTHDQSEAFAMGDRIAVMSNARLQQIGTTEDLINTPANLFVASFVGSPPVNLIEGRVSTDNDRLRFTAAGLSLSLPDQWKDRLNGRNAADVVLGLRPDALATTSEEPADTLTGQIEFIEPLLGETIVGIRVGAAHSLSANLDDVDPEALAEGQSLTLHVDAERIMLFDPETEKALE